MGCQLTQTHTHPLLKMGYYNVFIKIKVLSVGDQSDSFNQERCPWWGRKKKKLQMGENSIIIAYKFIHWYLKHTHTTMCKP